MTGVRLLVHQARYDLLAFLRNSEAMLFTVALPLVLLVFLTSVVGDQARSLLEHRDAATYYLPRVIVLGVVSATFFNLGVRLTILREAGILKRFRGTPAPAWSFVAGRVVTACFVSVVMVLILVVLARLMYGVGFRSATVPALSADVLVGATALSVLGVAITVAIPSDEAALPLMNALVIPLYLVSGILIPIDHAPGWITTIADFFPVRHFAAALSSALEPTASGAAVELGDLAVVAGWGLAGLLVAVRCFAWNPST